MKECPVTVSEATSRCPFLKAIKDTQGEDYANRLAVNAVAPSAGDKSKPIFPEDAFASLGAAFNLFHGDNGVIPLSIVDTTNKCPFHHQNQDQPPSQHVHDSIHLIKRATPGTSLPMASISLTGFKFMPDPREFFNNRPKPNKKNNNKPKPRKPSSPTNSNPPPSAASSSSSSPTTTSKPSSAPNKATTSNATSKTSKGSNPTNAKNTTNNPSPPPPPSSSSLSNHGPGRCPMRRVFGPFSGLLPLAVNGRLECPRAIVSMRAFIAGLEPVKKLRPQALPIRSLAMGGTAIAANVPCGMWREHTKKFSPEWFVAVHATIPFVAMLRKAVLMPKWAILLTIAGAIAGQGVGARIERRRLQKRSGLRKASTRVDVDADAGERREGDRPSYGIALQWTEDSMLKGRRGNTALSC